MWDDAQPASETRQGIYTTECCPSWTPHYVSAMLGFVSFSLVACLTPIIENILRRKQIYIICSLSKDENIYIFLHKEEQFQNKQKTCYQTKYTLPRIYRDRRQKKCVNVDSFDDDTDDDGGDATQRTMAPCLFSDANPNWRVIRHTKRAIGSTIYNRRNSPSSSISYRFFCSIFVYGVLPKQNPYKNTLHVIVRSKWDWSGLFRMWCFFFWRCDSNSLYG